MIWAYFGGYHEHLISGFLEGCAWPTVMSVSYSILLTELPVLAGTSVQQFTLVQAIHRPDYYCSCSLLFFSLLLSLFNVVLLPPVSLNTVCKTLDTETATHSK